MISMYRGELHKVSGITRQWPLPKPSITLSAFRQALEKRNDALRSCSSTPGFPTPCLTRQDTCVSGSHNVSPAHLRAVEGPREDPETDIGREGRGESDGHVKVDYMDEDVREEAEDAEDRSKNGGETRPGSYRSVGEEGYRDGSAPMEDSSARVLLRGQSFDGHEPKREAKLESAEPADLEDQMDRKERKKRKIEEASLIEARKGKVKVKVKEEVVVVAAAASGGVERMAIDAAGASDEMELDPKVVDKEAAAEGVDNHKRVNSEVDNTEKDGSDTIPELPMEEGNVKMEVNHDEQKDFVKVEAPTTPPVHSEEMNSGKPVEEKDHVEKAKATVDATGDKKAKKAELEAKLQKLTAEKHRLVQMLKQVLTTEKESKKRVQSASQSPSAPGPSSASQAIPSSTDVPAAPVVQSETTSAGGAEVTHKVDVPNAHKVDVPNAHKVDVPSAHKADASSAHKADVPCALKVDVPSATSHQVRPHRFGRHLTSSRNVQVLSTEEESKKKVQSTSQSPPAPGPQSASQAVPTSADVPAAPVVQPEAAGAGASEAQPSADLEEGELEYARTPSPPSHTTTTSHAASHGAHSHGSTPALGPLLGRQPQHLNQGGSARGNYYQQGLSLPSPSSAAAAAALAGAISPGTGFMPLALGGRPYNQHQMVMQALHAQKVAVAAAAAAAGHSHMSPILGGGGPAGAGNGVNNGPPGFGGYGGSPSVHGHHGHMPQGTSPGAGHIAAQQGVASPSLLTTPRGAPGYHDLRNLNPPWNLQR